ncbi:MAG: tRNA 2-thiocytidine(32) synthetase TtcA [Crocinitomicaceae bacterium]|nr:tRNA 2-thiocytidine(32) synthetase TtcA [Crocinitomicaceae bacterium]|tara:strand:+ start:954 stop:1781 length:828 start_codon:yes stop_codon:yes gene_type:complete
MANKSKLNQLSKKLKNAVAKAMDEFSMIEKGDKIMVCLSGGKDSYTMLDMMIHFQKYGNIQFEILAVNIDQKQPDYPEHILPDYLSKLEVNFKIVEKDTYSIVKDKIPEGKTMCSLCSRLRRGTIYDFARGNHCNKIALGHHREDLLETFFLNLFFSGKMETMPPKYKIDKGDLVVIRPLSFCKENEILDYSIEREFPIIPCNLCGSQTNMQRQIVKEMLNNWEKKYPNRKAIIFNALKNISPSHMLDHQMFNFEELLPLSNKKEFINSDEHQLV